MEDSTPNEKHLEGLTPDEARQIKNLAKITAASILNDVKEKAIINYSTPKNKKQKD